MPRQATQNTSGNSIFDSIATFCRDHLLPVLVRYYADRIREKAQIASKSKPQSRMNDGAIAFYAKKFEVLAFLKKLEPYPPFFCSLKVRAIFGMGLVNQFGQEGFQYYLRFCEQVSPEEKCQPRQEYVHYLNNLQPEVNWESAQYLMKEILKFLENPASAFTKEKQNTHTENKVDSAVEPPLKTPHPTTNKPDPIIPKAPIPPTPATVVHSLAEFAKRKEPFEVRLSHLPAQSQTYVSYFQLIQVASGIFQALGKGGIVIFRRFMKSVKNNQIEHSDDFYRKISRMKKPASGIPKALEILDGLVEELSVSAQLPVNTENQEAPEEEQVEIAKLESVEIEKEGKVLSFQPRNWAYSSVLAAPIGNMAGFVDDFGTTSFNLAANGDCGFKISGKNGRRRASHPPIMLLDCESAIRVNSFGYGGGRAGIGKDYRLGNPGIGRVLGAGRSPPEG